MRTGSNKQHKPQQRPIQGFTLIELLVVFTLLALLLSIAAPRYLSTVDNSKDKVRQQNLATLRDALDKFKSDKGRYPNELAELVSAQYLRSLPYDPVTGTQAWLPLTHPTGLEQGVYDVGPPSATALPAEAAVVPVTPSAQTR